MAERRYFASHPLRWVVEPLMGRPTYGERPVFGGCGCYLDGRLTLVLSCRGLEPWNGVLVPTERHHHESLLRELPNLEVHPILDKWLYLPEVLPEAFENTALRLIDLIAQADPRIGVRSPAQLP